MTAPDMVELGAAALWDRAAPVQKRARPNWAAVKDDPDWCRGVEETRADARAVLAAISEAGAVEWGVRYEWINDQGQPESEVSVKRTEALARLEAAFESSVSTIGEIEGPGITVVTRRVTTWTAVE